MDIYKKMFNRDSMSSERSILLRW